MANRAANVKQADITRYLAAVRKAGLVVQHLTVEPDGSVRIFTQGTADDGTNPCDRLLEP